MASRQEVYGTRAACRVLGYSPRVMEDLRNEDGFLFFRGPTGRIQYDKQYVDGIAAKIAMYPPRLRRKRDEVLFRLYTLQYKYVHAVTGLSDKQCRKYRKSIQSECDALVANGRAFIVADLASRIGKDPKRLFAWGRSGDVPIIQIGKRSFVSERFARYLIMLFTKMLTVAEAADAARMSIGQVEGKINRGEILSIKCVDGLHRLYPSTVAELEAAEDERLSSELLTITEAAKRLGVGFSSLARAVSQGLVTSTGEQRKRRIPATEIELRLKQFDRLNEPFAWLQPLVVSAGIKPQTLTADQAAKHLAVERKRLSPWALAGLIPFFPESVPTPNHERRRYLRLYIFGLSKFAGNQKTTQEILERYKELCQEKNCIV